MKYYNVQETADILGINPRSVQYRCRQQNVRKKDNKYLITDEILTKWQTKYDTPVAQETQLLKQTIAELRERLQAYQIQPNERIEVFTQEQYEIFEKRLREWVDLNKQITHQEQLFEVEKKSLGERLEHYKNLFEYQRTQNEKVLAMHQKLVDLIGEQSKITLQRNTIEAKEKGVK